MLCAVVFVDLLGLTLVLPTLPFHTADLGGTGLGLGLVLAAYSLAQAVAAPLLGRLADRFGRRRVLLLALAGSTVSLALMAFAPTVWLLVVSRLVAGACGGSIGVAHALAADWTTPERRTAAMGRLGMSIGAAFTIGPLLGAAASGVGFAAVALVGAGLSAGAWVLVWRALPAVTPARTPTVTSVWGPRPRALTAGGLLVAAFAGMCALVAMETTIAFLAESRFDAGPGFVGLLLCAAGLAMTLVQGGPLATAARRWGEVRVALGGALVMAVGLAAMPVVGAAAGLVGAVVLVAAGQGLLSTTVTSLLSRCAPARRGELLGRAQSAAALGRLIGPVGAGALYDLGMALPFAVAAGLAVCAAVAVGAGRIARPPLVVAAAPRRAA